MQNVNIISLRVPDFSFIIFHCFDGYDFFHKLIFCPAPPNFQSESLV